MPGGESTLPQQLPQLTVFQLQGTVMNDAVRVRQLSADRSRLLTTSLKRKESDRFPPVTEEQPGR